MNHNPLRSLALLVVLSAIGRGVEMPPEADVPLSEVPNRTKPQFDALATEAQGDSNKVLAVEWTRKLFDEELPKQEPADSKFTAKSVRSVGRAVGKILKLAIERQKTIEVAKARAPTDPVGANKLMAAADSKLQAGIAEIPPLVTVRSKTTSNANSATANTEKKDPAPHRVELSDIAVKAAESAYAKYERSDSGGNSNGSPGGPVPTGTGATPNGPAGGGLVIPTIGDVLGNTDPNSPSDAMTDARQRYSNGDIAGGMADASRAVALGGGAEALALRGEMELDQKSYAQAHQDAGQALQLDPSNQEALAVLHLSQVSSGAGAPQAISFGGADEAGGRAGLPRGAGKVDPVIASQSQLSDADLRREISNALRLNDLGSARALADRGLSHDPNNPSLLNMRASIEARMHDYEKAEADAKAGLALAPHNPALLRTRTYAQLRGGKFKDALDGAGELIALDPKDAYAYALRAHADGSLGDRDAMMADLDRAAALDANFVKIREQMAGKLQLPEDKDLLFLFPGEEGAAAKTAAPEGGRRRNFGLLIGASLLGGLLIALGLLQAVMDPLKRRLTSAFTRAGSAPKGGAAPPDNGSLPGLIRGQYEISRQIGAGGMGMVFAGTDRSLGRPVAIKKMREELRINPRERERFVIEARTVAALHHPNIVDIYAIAEDGDDVYLIFEFVGGKTVHDLVQRSGRMPTADAARVVRAAADALDYAHSRGVVHRDMKPSNMMIDAEGRIKVMDFGIARMAKDAMTRYSMTNTVVGTPPYMAPEQEQGQVRRESDVYALAVCAYEMLTGKLPFIGIGAGMLMNKINMSYIAPSRAIAGIPEALDPVFVKAFQADPDKRHRTPKEFADAFAAALSLPSRA